MAGLKFIADMDISPLTVNRLKESGWEIIRVSDVMDARTSDIEILNYARDHNKVVKWGSGILCIPYP